GRPGLGIRLALHTLGALAITVGMLLEALPLVVTGASVVALASAAHAVVVALQLRGAPPARFSALVRYYIAAAVVFLGGLALGASMADLGGGSDARDRLVTAHLVLNAFGWIGLTVLGTLVLLWPTVLHARVQDSVDAAGRRALPLLVAGAAIAAVGPLV